MLPRGGLAGIITIACIIKKGGFNPGAVHSSNHIFLLCLCGSSKILKGEFADRGCVHAWSYAWFRESCCCATDLCIWWRICHSSSSMVVWTRVWFCGGAALLPCATQRRVELYGHDSAIPRCMARSASWPSINPAGLICNWISMAPSNVAIAIRSRYLAAPKAHRNFWPSPPPPSAK